MATAHDENGSGPSREVDGASPNAANGSDSHPTAETTMKERAVQVLLDMGFDRQVAELAYSEAPQKDLNSVAEFAWSNVVRLGRQAVGFHGSSLESDDGGVFDYDSTEEAEETKRVVEEGTKATKGQIGPRKGVIEKSSLRGLPPALSSSFLGDSHDEEGNAKASATRKNNDTARAERSAAEQTTEERSGEETRKREGEDEEGVQQLRNEETATPKNSFSSHSSQQREATNDNVDEENGVASSSEAPISGVNRHFLNVLLEMGVEREVAIEALRATGSESIAVALDWALAFGESLKEERERIRRAELLDALSLRPERESELPRETSLLRGEGQRTGSGHYGTMEPVHGSTASFMERVRRW